MRLDFRQSLNLGGAKVNFFYNCIFFSFCRTRLGMKPSILKNDPLESDFNYQKTQQHKSNNRQEKLQDDMPSVGLVQSTTGFSSTSRTFLSSVLIILCNTCVILFCSSILFWVWYLNQEKIRYNLEVYILTYMLEKCSMKEKTKENQVEEKENIIKI